MTEIRNIEADLSRFRLRVLVASIVIVLAFVSLASRLVYLQVVRHEDLSEQAESNRTAVVPVVPNPMVSCRSEPLLLGWNFGA